MQNKKVAVTFLLAVFLFIPLATAVTPTPQPWGISTKDWTLADPNATLIPTPPPTATPTPTPQTNSSITPSPSSTNNATATPTPTATPIGQTPTPTSTTSAATTPTPTPILTTYTNSLPIIPIVIAVVLLGISIPGIYFLLRSRNRSDGEIEQ